MLYSGKAPSLQEECHASAWPQLTTDLPLSSVSWIGPGDNAVGCFFKKMLSVYLLARKKKKKKSYAQLLHKGENWRYFSDEEV